MKKKLRLQIEQLHVEQFEVQPDSATARGTVHGLDSTHSYSGEDHCICFPMPDSRHMNFSDCC